MRTINLENLKISKKEKEWLINMINLSHHKSKYISTEIIIDIPINALVIFFTTFNMDISKVTKAQIIAALLHIVKYQIAKISFRAKRVKGLNLLIIFDVINEVKTEMIRIELH